MLITQNQRSAISYREDILLDLRENVCKPALITLNNFKFMLFIRFSENN